MGTSNAQAQTHTHTRPPARVRYGTLGISHDQVVSCPHCRHLILALKISRPNGQTLTVLWEPDLAERIRISRIVGFQVVTAQGFPPTTGMFHECLALASGTAGW